MQSVDTSITNYPPSSIHPTDGCKTPSTLIVSPEEQISPIVEVAQTKLSMMSKINRWHVLAAVSTLALAALGLTMWRSGTISTANIPNLSTSTKPSETNSSLLNPGMGVSITNITSPSNVTDVISNFQQPSDYVRLPITPNTYSEYFASNQSNSTDLITHSNSIIEMNSSNQSFITSNIASNIELLSIPRDFVPEIALAATVVSGYAMYKFLNMKTLPYFLLYSGSTIGSGLNFVNSNSLHIKSAALAVCKSFKKAPVISHLNLIRQWEVKRFALATPLILLGTFWASQRCRTTSQKKPGENPKFADTLIPIALATSIFALNIPMSMLAKSTGFDPSGHVMMKTMTTHSVVSVCDYMRTTGYNKLAATVGLAVALADGVFLANTSACHHTVAESVAGAAIAVSLIAAAHGIRKIKNC